jgi:hypothetical protein
LGLIIPCSLPIYITELIPEPTHINPEDGDSIFLQYLLPIERVGVPVMLHTYIQELLGSNPGQDTGYYDRLFMVILNPSRQMLG